MTTDTLMGDAIIAAWVAMVPPPQEYPRGISFTEEPDGTYKAWRSFYAGKSKYFPATEQGYRDACQWRTEQVADAARLRRLEEGQV